MYRWNSSQLADKLRQVPHVESVVVGPPGGDVDTENLLVNLEGTTESLYVCGFSTEDAFMDIDYDEKGDIDVEMVELTDGCDSSGGLVTDCEITGHAYVSIRKLLIDDGADVVRRLKNYF